MSKRGWTTYLVGATRCEKCVKILAIVPMVPVVPNINAEMKRMW
jgi:PhoPQ-activated pathogenicity-related protein